MNHDGKNGHTTLLSWFISYFPILLVASVGTLLTLAGSWYLHTDQQKKFRREFQWFAQERLMVLQTGIDNHLTIVENLRGLFSSSDVVERNEFQIFVSPILDRYQEVHALEWIPRVTKAERAKFEKMAQETFPDFQITEQASQGDIIQAGSREEYFPVYYLEPFIGNEAALGFDLASDPVRRKAIEKARDSGKMVVSEKIMLVQEAGQQYGFLVFHPVFSKDAPSVTLAQRRKHLLGFTLGVYRIGDLIEGILENHLQPKGIDFWLQDITVDKGDRILYFHTSRKASEKLPSFPTEEMPSIQGEHVTGVLQIADRQWSYTATPNAIFEIRTEEISFARWVVLVAGVTLTMLLMLFLHRTKEYNLAMIKKESRYRMLFECMTSGVAVYKPINAGEDFVFLDLNPAGQRSSHVKKEEVVGQRVTDAFPMVKQFGLFKIFQSVHRTGQMAHHPVSFYKDERVEQWVENWVYRLPSGEIDVATVSRTPNLSHYAASATCPSYSIGDI